MSISEIKSWGRNDVPQRTQRTLMLGIILNGIDSSSSDLGLFSCLTCDREKDKPNDCDNLKDSGLKNFTWNCWRPKGIILIWDEKTLKD